MGSSRRSALSLLGLLQPAWKAARVEKMRVTDRFPVGLARRSWQIELTLVGTSSWDVLGRSGSAGLSPCRCFASQAEFPARRSSACLVKALTCRSSWSSLSDWRTVALNWVMITAVVPITYARLKTAAMHGTNRRRLRVSVSMSAFGSGRLATRQVNYTSTSRTKRLPFRQALHETVIVPSAPDCVRFLERSTTAHDR